MKRTTQVPETSVILKYMYSVYFLTLMDLLCMIAINDVQFIQKLIVDYYQPLQMI